MNYVELTIRTYKQQSTQRAAECLANGITHDDGRGGITNLLGFIDDISTVVPLEDLLFLCQQFEEHGLKLDASSTQSKLEF